MSATVDRRCMELARTYMGVPDGDARRLCADPDMRQCAAGLLPRPDETQATTLENLMACYRSSSSGTGRSHDV